MGSVLYIPLVIAAIMLFIYTRNRQTWVLKGALLLLAATLFSMAFRSGYIRRYQPPRILLANGCIEQRRGYVKKMYC